MKWSKIPPRTPYKVPSPPAIKRVNGTLTLVNHSTSTTWPASINLWWACPQELDTVLMMVLHLQTTAASQLLECTQCWSIKVVHRDFLPLTISRNPTKTSPLPITVMKSVRVLWPGSGRRLDGWRPFLPAPDKNLDVPSRRLYDGLGID